MPGGSRLAAVAEAGTTFPAFIANLQRLGLRSWVDVRVGTSVEIGSRWQAPIRLLFIDGDHSYEATRVDVETWSRHIIPGGIMVFHDVGVWPGVTQMYQELISANSIWKQVAKVRSLRAAQRAM
jgi:predicted O-methyltransferase YrrM